MNRGLLGFPARATSNDTLLHLDAHAETPTMQRSFELDFADPSARTRLESMAKVNWTYNALEFDGDSVPGGLFLELPSATAFRALLRPLPSGDFDAVAHFAQCPRYGVPGIIMSDGITAGAGNQCIIYAYAGGATRVGGLSRYTNFLTFGTVLVTERDLHTPHVWMRIRRVGSTFSAGWSENGRIWSHLSAFTPTGTMAHIGLVFAPVSGVISRFGAYSFRIYQPTLPINAEGRDRRLVVAQ